MSKNDNTGSISADVSRRFEDNAQTKGEVSDQATKEATSLVVVESGQPANSLQPDITVTRQQEGTTVEGQSEKQGVYRYAVAMPTHQMLHQTIEIVSDRSLTDKQIAERAFEEAQKEAWEQGQIDQSIDIDNVTEE